MSVYNRVFNCGICGRPVTDHVEMRFHKECVIDTLYDTYIRFEKPSRKLLDRARKYGVKPVEIRRQVIEDACGRLRND